MNYFFRGVIFFALFFLKTQSFAQFAPAAEQFGTSAIYKDSSVFISWANSGIVVRGLQDVSMPVNGFVNVGDSASAFGMAGTNGVVSLGDGGYAILQFTSPIVNEFGPDFAVFEKKNEWLQDFQSITNYGTQSTVNYDAPSFGVKTGIIMATEGENILVALDFSNDIIVVDSLDIIILFDSGISSALA